MFLDLLIVGLILLLIGSLPTWRWSRSWGFYGTDGIAALLFSIALLLFCGVV